jgi:hypothetical protein
MPRESIEAVLERHARRIVSLPGVVGVGAGEADGRTCIMVYVVEKTATAIGRIPTDLEGWPVVVRKSGGIRALTDEH